MSRLLQSRQEGFLKDVDFAAAGFFAACKTALHSTCVIEAGTAGSSGLVGGNQGILCLRKYFSMARVTS